jgi:hypothetical protein
MKTKIVLAFLMAAFTLSSTAQMVPRPKRECTSLCIERDPSNPRKTVFEEKLKQIRDKLKNETDSAKTKSLRQEEEDLIDQHQDDLEKMCKAICKNNPDE